MRALALIFGLLIITGCKATPSFTEGDVYSPSTVTAGQICHDQKFGKCPSNVDINIKDDWNVIRGALLGARGNYAASDSFAKKVFGNARAIGTRSYMEEALLIQWGILNRVARRDCALNDVGCRPYREESLAEEYSIKEYLGGLSSYREYKVDNADYVFSVIAVSEVSITNGGVCRSSELRTLDHVCEYLNTPMIPEKERAMRGVRMQNPLARRGNTSPISGEWLIFRVKVKARGLGSSHDDFSSIYVDLGVKTSKQDLIGMSWNQVQRLARGAMLIIGYDNQTPAQRESKDEALNKLLEEMKKRVPPTLN